MVSLFEIGLEYCLSLTLSLVLFLDFADALKLCETGLQYDFADLGFDYSSFSCFSRPPD